MKRTSINVRPFNLSAVEPPLGFHSFSWPETFVDGAPLDLEIGCGVGWHPIRYANANPNRRLVAIEQTRDKFNRFTSRLERHPELTNLLAIHADAVRWVSHALQSESIDRCFILYPNPEPKSRSKRWFCMPFFAKLISTLKLRGTITLATNEEFYWREAEEMAEKTWGLKIVDSRLFSAKDVPDHQARTHFEKKYLARGETCFELVVCKL